MSGDNYHYTYKAFWERPDLFSLAGADKFQELQKRVVRELESLFVIRENSYILVVSHWIAIKVALAHYLSIPLSNLSGITDPVNGEYICLSKRGNDVHILQQQPNKALQTN